MQVALDLENAAITQSCLSNRNQPPCHRNQCMRGCRQESSRFEELADHIQLLEPRGPGQCDEHVAIPGR